MWRIYVCVMMLMGGYVRAITNNSRSTGIPVCPPPPARCRYEKLLTVGSISFHQYNVDGIRVKIRIDGALFLLDGSYSSLESKSFPQLNQSTRFPRVVLSQFLVPTKSYSEALVKLGINTTAIGILELVDVPPTPSLQAHHFMGLQNLRFLQIASIANQLYWLRPANNFLTPLESLRELWLSRILLQSAIFLLPKTLRILNWNRGKMESFPTRALERLKFLERLKLKQENLQLAPNVTAATALRVLEINAPLVTLPSFKRLREVTLEELRLEKVQAISECSDLQEFTASAWRGLNSLPSGWIKNCTLLSKISIENMGYLRELPPRFLEGAANLRELKISYTALHTLPKDMFIYTKNLQQLEISSNEISSIPRGVFSDLHSLQTLNLRNNRITVGHMTSELKPMKSLRDLSLEHNDFGDLCDADKQTGLGRVSSLSPLKGLHRLSLSHTKATRICSDWRLDMKNLTHIDLSYNQFTHLQYPDLQFNRSNPTVIDLQGNEMLGIWYKKQDYLTIMKNNNTKKSLVTLDIGLPFKCDCRLYWFSKALREKPSHVIMSDIRCRDKQYNAQSWFEVTPEKMTCPLPKNQCFTNCSCEKHLPDEMTVINCEVGALHRIPHSPLLRELYAPHNVIDTIEPDDLPDSLTTLDLQHNKIARVSEEAAIKLFEVPNRRVLLGGNQLDCECDNKPFLVVLQQHRSQVPDFNNITCIDGQFVVDIDTEVLCLISPSVLAGIIIALCAILLAMLGAVAALYYRHERTIKVFLYSRGWCSCWVHEQELDRDKFYDAFVSFSHGDEAIVLDELVPRLENSPHPYKLCLHYRDWLPGDYIPEQIVRSVNDSRRTIIVLSNNFLESVWGMLEFRTAHIAALREGRARVIVILIDDFTIDDERLDEELHSYLATNTYVKWNDPWFWRKLRYALPHPYKEQHKTLTKPVSNLVVEEVTLKNTRNCNIKAPILDSLAIKDVSVP